MKLTIFNQLDFLPALKALFKDLNVPINYVADEPTTAREILEETYKDNATFNLVDEVYFVGMVDDAAFEGNKSIAADKIKSDYDGILIFGITLNRRDKGLLPTRSQLAEISRAFNREFYYTPVIVVFKYNNHLAFANTERLQYKQEWREGEKAGKVTLLRDINIQKPHSGHERILNELRIPTTGRNSVDSFAKLYAYWQEVFSVSLLNKQFYQELSNWYFWAIKQVTFPGMPTAKDAHAKKADLDDLIQEHKATNVIRLLTRLLFVWFVKEKKLIPDELFELDSLQKDILKNISPYHEKGMFKEANSESIYYKAILQNLFFATLNCPIEGDSLDKRKRGFRGEGYGANRGIDYLMRYKEYFRKPEKFLELVNSTVPFLNGGLFECLDDKFNNIYIDGFSDGMTKGEKLIVPDYLFFGIEEKADLSKEYGINNKDTKGAAVKGLINILKSYKFTVTENTPIEEDVALDPELLGKVFENLLASYNPETKTTARKQTGSFYTPREIVNYMVDESLIAYLKNKLQEEPEEFAEVINPEEIDSLLHQLVSFDPVNPFAEQPDIVTKIIKALDKCTILDPACGSGAFPMGILQKMAHILQKLDPENMIWKEVQRSKVIKETEDAFEIEDRQAREDQLIEINNAFDQSINDPDYARKLFLIENCIYGVDIQPIATQISKLRFFISLVVEQKPDPEKANFGIRPLPNLETKFVAANTLVGIEKPKAQLSLYNTDAVKALETQLKKVRHKLFSAKSKDTKLKYRQIDEELRNTIAEEFEKSGWKSNTAQMLANWDPYDQNASSPFFDPEWMFDNSDGFDIVIGNPPYIKEFTDKSVFDGIRYKKYYEGKMDIWYAFACLGIDLIKENGLLCFIATNNWVTNSGATILRHKVLTETKIEQLLDFGSYMIFESASIQTMILLARKGNYDNYLVDHRKIKAQNAGLNEVNNLLEKEINEKNSIHQFQLIKQNWLGKTLNFESEDIESILQKIKAKANFFLNDKKEVAQGIVAPQDFLNKKGKEQLGSNYSVGEGIFNLSDEELNDLSFTPKEYELIKPFYTSNELGKYYGSSNNKYWIIYTDSIFKNSNAIKPYPNLKRHLDRFKRVITSHNGPYGLHRARVEDFFIGEKIISLRKCATPTFTYTDFDCYVSQTYFVIKSNRIDQRYLTGLLNSRLVALWLKYKGKMQGHNYQIDKEPILDIPIFKIGNQEIVADIVSEILLKKANGKETLDLEQKIDSIFFKMYDLSYEEIKVLDPKTEINKEEYDVLDFEFETIGSLNAETDNETQSVYQKVSSKGRSTKVDLSKPVEFDL